MNRFKKWPEMVTQAGIYGLEMMNMPWYMSPDITCKILNRIAARHARAKLPELHQVLDHTTQKIWCKQESYHKKTSTTPDGY